jgi:hypothetical protein
VPFDLSLPQKFRQAGWKVKIRDKEIREHPHVTILRKTQCWRVNLRNGEFMDAEPDPDEVPKELVGHVMSEAVWGQLCDEWDKKYPQNPVIGEQDSGGEQDNETNA